MKQSLLIAALLAAALTGCAGKQGEEASEAAAVASEAEVAVDASAEDASK